MSVTIKDIAREAGVSYASVSRALSGSRGVSVKTAQRILAVAKKLSLTTCPTALRATSSTSAPKRSA